MSEYFNLNTPLTTNQITKLKVGDLVYLSGTIFTARDQAHKRIVEYLNKGLVLPISLTNQIIYYTGPTDTAPNKIIGSCGPTSSYRMDTYAPILLDEGLKVMIGKGKRSASVIKSIRKNKALYLGALGGSGALMASKVTSCKVVGFADLLSEGIYQLNVKDMPLVVLIDSEGNDFYQQ